MAIFMNPHLNGRWNSGLGKQILKQRGGQMVAHQVYPLPWPFSDREFVVACSENIDHARRTFYQSCRSVEDPAFPAGADNVRAVLEHSSWQFRQLQDGRTSIHFETSVDVGGALPTWIVSAGQKMGSQQLMTALLAVQKRLALPPREEFARWSVVAAPFPPSLSVTGRLLRAPQHVLLEVVRLPAIAVAATRSATRSMILNHPLRHVPKLPPPMAATPMQHSEGLDINTAVAIAVFSLLLMCICMPNQRSGLASPSRKGPHSSTAAKGAGSAAATAPDGRSSAAADLILCLTAAFALAFVWFVRCLPAVWALVHGPLTGPLLVSPFVEPSPSALTTPFALVSAASHTGAVAVGVAIGEQTRTLPSRHRFFRCLCTALSFFAALTLCLRIGFEAKLPLVHPLALLFFDADATLPFALLGGASVTTWLSFAMAIQHHPLGRQLQGRRTASAVVLLAVASYQLDAKFRSLIWSTGAIATVAVPCLIAGVAAARMTAAGRDA